MTDITVSNVISADDLRTTTANAHRLINVNKTVSEMLEFAFTRIEKAAQNRKSEITFNFKKALYNKWIEGIKPETLKKVHDRFANYLEEQGYDIEDNIDIDYDSEEVLENTVKVSW